MIPAVRYEKDGHAVNVYGAGCVKLELPWIPARVQMYVAVFVQAEPGESRDFRFRLDFVDGNGIVIGTTREVRRTLPPGVRVHRLDLEPSHDIPAEGEYAWVLFFNNEPPDSWPITIVRAPGTI